jgi:hypothetical protein
MPGVWSDEVLLQRIRSHPSDAACVIGALEIGDSTSAGGGLIGRPSDQVTTAMDLSAKVRSQAVLHRLGVRSA